MCLLPFNICLESDIKCYTWSCVTLIFTWSSSLFFLWTEKSLGAYKHCALEFDLTGDRASSRRRAQSHLTTRKNRMEVYSEGSAFTLP